MYSLTLLSLGSDRAQFPLFLPSNSVAVSAWLEEERCMSLAALQNFYPDQS